MPAVASPFKRNAFSSASILDPPRWRLPRGTYHLIHDAIQRKRHRSRT
jgi:hypothetical protein